MSILLRRRAMMLKRVLLPVYEYTGEHEMIIDGSNWMIYFLSSGTLNFSVAPDAIDVFLVGGGGGSSQTGASRHYQAGGGGGYTKTINGVFIATDTNYAITVGSGGVGGGGERQKGDDGGASMAFGYTANGGKGGAYLGNGGNGGSGGNCYNYNTTYLGNVNGANGGSMFNFTGGIGQGTTTALFGVGTDYYADGGSYGRDTRANHGDGGKVAYGSNLWGYSGSGGVVVIRNRR